MRDFPRRHPILCSILVILAMLIASTVWGLILDLTLGPFGYAFLGDYGVQLAAELGILLVMVGVTYLLGMQKVFICRGRGFFRSLIPGVVLIGLYALAAVELFFSSYVYPLQPLRHILFYVLCMGSIGLCEELIFRGLITGMLYERYGSSPAGVWFSVLLSSLLFGAVHLSNAAGGASLTGVLVQVIGAVALGMCLAAIYLRGRNLWSVAAIHGFMDFCALLDSGLFQGQTLTDSISEYDISSLLGTLLYLVMAIILLRPKCISDITSRNDNTKGDVVRLGSVTFLLGIMTGFVVVLCI